MLERGLQLKANGLRVQAVVVRREPEPAPFLQALPTRNGATPAATKSRAYLRLEQHGRNGASLSHFARALLQCCFVQERAVRH
jgi:hypothetical protein